MNEKINNVFSFPKRPERKADETVLAETTSPKEDKFSIAKKLAILGIDLAVVKKLVILRDRSAIAQKKVDLAASTPPISEYSFEEAVLLFQEATQLSINKTPVFFLALLKRIIKESDDMAYLSELIDDDIESDDFSLEEAEKFITSLGIDNKRLELVFQMKLLSHISEDMISLAVSTPPISEYSLEEAASAFQKAEEIFIRKKPVFFLALLKRIFSEYKKTTDVKEL